MIEIKFRAFHKGEMHPCYVGVDGLVRIEQSDGVIDVPLIIGSTSTYKGSIIKETLNPVMQFTGLKDRDGKDIYEGDIVQAKNDVFEIVYSNNDFCHVFWSNSQKNYMTLPFLKGIKDFEVIGNIYENPKLLEASHDT